MYCNDPDTEIIKNICKKLIGSKINIKFTITLENDEIYNNEIDNCNIIGNCMENILFPFLKKNIPTIEKGPKQASPDFYNRNKNWEYELKCFTDHPGFDISNFNSYIEQISENLERKLYKTQYLIFKYIMDKNIIHIIDFNLYNIWNILSYNGKYPISLQSKKGIWYNIRPCCFNDMNNIIKTPILFIEKICEAILKTPNKIENKKKIIKNIKDNFYRLQFKIVLLSINKLNI